MKQTSENEELIIRYLLGDLSDSESVEIEDRYFADNDFFEEMTMVEKELIDSYISGRLPGRERQRFEDKYLTSPTRRSRVKLAENLMKALHDQSVFAGTVHSEVRPTPQSLFTIRNRLLQFAFAAVVLLTIAVPTWLAFENRRLRNEINRLQDERAAFEQKEKELAEQAAQQNVRTDELIARLEKEENDRRQLETQIAQLQPQPIPVFELASGGTRSGNASQSFNIPSAAKTIKFKLYLEPDDYKIYRATLLDAGRANIWSKNGLRARTTASGKEMILSLPAELISSGDYRLTLGGAVKGNNYEGLSNYEFKVVKK
ncbi:MAG TPA: hypothetical protein VLR90_16690 [Blastocatellia bacterium]|nr:hypothetical protein [Blastocatellia bacterium]